MCSLYNVSVQKKKKKKTTFVSLGIVLVPRNHAFGLRVPNPTSVPHKYTCGHNMP